MKKTLRIVLLLVLAALVVWTFYFLYQKSVEPPAQFNTEKAEKTNIIKKTVATGSILPRKEIEIKPQVSGIVEELFVEPGETVKEGDLIAKVKIIPDMAQLNAAENRLNRAKISVDAAKLDYDRNKKLYDNGVISAAQFQVFDIAYKNALEEFDAAQANLEIIKEGAARKSGEAANTLVRATSTGMVLDIPVEEGNSVIEANTFNEGTTIASIADLGEMVFEGQVDESEVGKIKTGMDLILRIGAIQDEEFSAVLEYISPKGVEENGAIQFEIKAAVELKEDFFIRAGYSANADIVLARVDSVLAIKESLVQYDEEQTYVEVQVGEQIFERRDVTTGLSDGIIVEVTEGIGADDEIKVWNKPIQ
jgi:HlyD family secretion protein